MALTPLHSLRLVVGHCEVVARRSFRGTWERTPPDPTGLDVGAEGAGRLHSRIAAYAAETGCAGVPSGRKLASTVKVRSVQGSSAPAADGSPADRPW